MKRARYLLASLCLIVACLLQGCATKVRPLPTAEDHIRWTEVFRRVDRIVDKACVRDAASFPVHGVPYLRSNRFLHAQATPWFTPPVQSPPSDLAWETWLRHMQALDLAAREREIDNLPDPALKNLSTQLGLPPQRTALKRFIFTTSTRWLEADLVHARPDVHLYQAATPSSEYADWLRVIGIYPLTALPVRHATLRVQEKFRGWHTRPPQLLQAKGKWVTYTPPSVTGTTPTQAVAIFSTVQRDALGIPILTTAQQELLVCAFAPVYSQDTVSMVDRIGAVTWHDGDPVTDPHDAVVYYYLTHAFYQETPIVQINYVHWYAARKGGQAPWYEQGRLDGMTVRVSLDPAGKPFMVDIMNNCGCYHLFLPARDQVMGIRHDTTVLGLDPFTPTFLPPSFPAAPLHLKIKTGWHQVQHIGTHRPEHRSLHPSSSTEYRLVPYTALERIPLPEGGSASLFNSRGIGKGTARIEPLIFFPMGIPAVGSMRQRGHHAIKLVGKDHFDDPGLFNRHFEFGNMTDWHQTTTPEMGSPESLP